MVTIRQKWEKLLSLPSYSLTDFYLKPKFPLVVEDDNLFIDGSLLPTPDLVTQILKLSPGKALAGKDTVLAFRIDRKELIIHEKAILNRKTTTSSPFFKKIIPIDQETQYIQINHLSDIFVHNKNAILYDFQLFTKDKTSQVASPTNLIIGNPNHLFIEEGVEMEGAIINVTEGYIYLGKNAKIMEGALLKGTVAIGEEATVMPYSRLSNGTTIGPHCKVGGEINNVVFMGYSNKAHDGFIGNAVIGEWCNIGAGSNFSNLKNNYGTVRQWFYPDHNYKNTGLQFCGIVMGDYSKCSIGSNFNTGTVVGIACNLFGADFHDRYVKSFSFGPKDHQYLINKIDKVIETASIVCQRRHLYLSHTDQQLLEYLFLLENLETE
jgi:UDP-N-acetylglucosamine diphosphorylase/glucosamine-1-phosphate N-acetyltransferase